MAFVSKIAVFWVAPLQHREYILGMSFITTPYYAECGYTIRSMSSVHLSGRLN